MRDLKKQEQAAIEAIVRQFSATLEKGNDSPDVYITVAGKRIAVDITTLKQRGAAQGNVAKPRLRFDRVATGVIKRLQAALGETVPDGITMLLTITAPIRMPSKTAAALEDKIRTLLGRGSAGREEKDTINGNRVRILCLRNETTRAPKVIGFVHNPESDPLLLFNMTRELLELISAEAGRRATTLAGERWLVAICARDSSYAEVYRYIYSQLTAGTIYKKTVMVFGDGHLAILAG